MRQLRSLPRAATVAASILLSSGLALVASFFVMSLPAYAANGDVTVNVTREADGAAVGSATVMVKCDGGDFQSIGTTDGSGVVTVAQATIGDATTADCQDTETITVLVGKDGYVTNSSYTAVYTTAAPNTINATNLRFAYRFTLDDETVDDNAILSAAATMGATHTSCVGSSNVMYCPVPLADTDTTATATKDGYVTKVFTVGSARSASTTAQVVNSAQKNMQHAVKITLRDEMDESNLVTGASVRTGNGATTSCVEDGGDVAVYYCAVPLANTITHVLVSKTGYVDLTASNAWTDRVAATDAQQAITVSNFQHSQVVHVTRQGDSGDVSGLTMTAGALSVACNEDGSSGYYYCPVAETDDGGEGDISFSGTGYISGTGSTGNRAAADSAQASVSITDVQFALVVNAADELGTTIGPDTVTFDGHIQDLQIGDTLYFAQTLSNKVLVINKAGFVNNRVTNSVLGDVSTGAGTQTVVTLGNYAADSDASIAAGTTVTIKGLQYKLKSLVFRSELGGLVSGIMSGAFATNGRPSVDVKVTGGEGVTIVGAASQGDAVYIALTGSGGGGDTFGVALGDVSADGGSVDAAKFVVQTFTDPTNLIFAGGSAPQKTYGAGATGGDGTPDITATGLLYPLKVTVEDQLGNAENIGTLSSITYNTLSPYMTDGANVAYFSNLNLSGQLAVNKDGFIPGWTTNSGFFDRFRVQTSTQTVINMGTNPAASSITTGITNNVKGLQYVLQSGVLKSEVGGAVTSIATGHTTDGTPSADVTLVGSNGANVVESAVSGGTIYAAVTGDGATGGADTVTVQVQNVTVDSGVADGAKLVKATLVDTDNLITGLADVVSFDVGDGGSGAITTGGFEYPLKVNFADQLGNALSASAMNVKTFNGVSPYYSSGSTSYWASIGTHGLVLSKNGFIPNATTNSGLTAITPNQDSQMTVNLGDNSASGELTDGASNDIRGLVYALRTGVLQSELGGNITGLTDSGAFEVCGGDPCALTGQVMLHGAGGATIIGGAVAGDVIYVAATGNGGENDQFMVYPHGITVDGGAAEGADLGAVDFIDSADTVFGNAAQGVMDSGPSVIAGSLHDSVGYQYPLKVVVRDQLGNSINVNNLDTITFNDAAPYVSSTNVAYFAQQSISSEALVVQKDGYVNGGTTNAGYADVSTDPTSGQTLITMNTGSVLAAPVTAGSSVTSKGLVYALKVAVQREGDNAALTGSTVTAGNNYGTTCSEDGTSGIHYCAIPLADTSTTARIVRSSHDYLTKYLNYTDRTAVTDGQGVITGVLTTPGDVTAPIVESQTPTNGSEDVAITVSPTITFSEDMDPSTLNGGTIKLKKFSDNSDITTTLLYNPSTFTVTLDPDVNLATSTEYYLWIGNAKDLAGNVESTDYSTGTKGSHAFTTSAVGDTGAPVISDIEVSSITSSTAVVTWTTDESSTSTIQYGLTSSYGSTSSSDSSVTSHSITLTGLTASTVYHFRAKSGDTSYNVGTSVDGTFTTEGSGLDTTAPVITDIEVSSITSSTAVVTWTTDEVSTSTVQYGTTSSYGSTTSSASSVTSHSITITGLSAATTYHFRVKSGDPSFNVGTSVDGAFTTASSGLDTTPPVITNIQVSSITSSTASVTWTTDEASTSTVQYGLTSSYGSTSSSNSATTSHTINLTGLTPNSVYHFRVKSTDGSSNTQTSVDGVFTTAVDDSSAVLSVTGIANTQAYATADNTFTNGWKWTFNVTVPTTETAFRMKFSDLISGSNSIDASNLRFYTNQSSDATSTSPVSITSSNTYSRYISLSSDLDPSTAGRQIQVVVEARVPVSSAGGSYSTSYGISSVVPE